MSWGTNYKYEGVISRVGINELEQKLEETQNLLNGIREEMIALMAMSPPANGMVEDEDGGKNPLASICCPQTELPLGGT